jgi:DNA-binding SARP family transcriptional activator/tetratricopeptide (TPR) repeat protein
LTAAAEFGLLGPLFVRRGGTPVEIPRGKQRILLAALLLNANRVISVDELCDTLWESAPPASAQATLQNYVKRLRACFGDAGHRRIITVPPGYSIRVEDGELDVQRFESHLAAGRSAAHAGAWNEAAARLTEALSLWRGEPLDGVSSTALALREVPRLSELRLQTAEARVDADLHLGRPEDVIAELRRLVHEHPLREKLHAQLMLALYRDGRQADSLAAYQAVRDTLIHELGTEPGIELRNLHARILTHDAGLTGPSPAAVTGQTRPPGEGPAPGEVAAAEEAGTERTGRPPAVVPRQLPAATRHFTGRTAELGTLTRLLENAADEPETVLISAIGGMPGIGKTALALRWAHQVAEQFPDGQLYVNLRGFDPSGEPLDPAAVIRGFLGALHIPAEAIPADLNEQAALYRSVLAGRRILIMLDNARDTSQLRPLLPGTPGCLVLVTSRRQLASLVTTEGAHTLTLDLLTRAEAHELLTRRVGVRRVATESRAADELIELCGRLPLALAIAAARTAARPRASLATLTAELREEQSRLDALDAGEAPASVRAVFSWSYQSLAGPAARMFRLLGVHPGPDTSGPAAASLAAIPPTAARQALEELASANLLAEEPAGRYYLHDLVRAYATELGRRPGDPQSGHSAAEGRILDHYLHTCHAAAQRLDSARNPGTLAPPQPGVQPESLASHDQALAWVEAEHQVLLTVVAHAARHGYDSHARQLALALETFLLRRGYWHDLAETQRMALEVATRAGDPAGQALAHHGLGRAMALVGSLPQAQAHLSRALNLYEQLGDHPSAARAHIDMSTACAEHGRFGEALEHAIQARDLFAADGDRTGYASALNNIGWDQIHLGQNEQAVLCCEEALAAFRELGDRYGEAAVLDSLGYAHHHLGNYARGIARCREALVVFHELGDRYNQANVLIHIGDNLSGAGEEMAARDAWRRALDILDELNHPDTGQVHARLALAGQAS